VFIVPCTQIWSIIHIRRPILFNLSCNAYENFR
jgi:hypothetical protein